MGLVYYCKILGQALVVFIVVSETKYDIFNPYFEPKLCQEAITFII